MEHVPAEDDHLHFHRDGGEEIARPLIAEGAHSERPKHRELSEKAGGHHTRSWGIDRLG